MTDPATEKGPTVTEAFPWESVLDETPTVEPTPAPPLSEEEAEIVDRFDSAPDALEDETPPEEAPTTDVEISDAVIDRRAAEELLDDLGGHPDALAKAVGSMKDTILDVVRTRGDARRAARVAKLDGKEPRTSTDVRGELIGATGDAEVLDAFAAAFAAGGKEAKGLAGDLLDELPGRGGKPRASTKAADGHGWEIVLTRTPRRELSVDVDALVDVVAAMLLGDAQRAHEAAKAAGAEETSTLALSRPPAAIYADAVRAALATFRGLLSASPGFKSTALDSLATTLEDVEGDDLANRLRKAYGRVEKGEPAVKVERRPLKSEGDE